MRVIVKKGVSSSERAGEVPVQVPHRVAGTAKSAGARGEDMVSLRRDEDGHFDTITNDNGPDDGEDIQEFASFRHFHHPYM
ncbi:hypothetical protein CWS72_21985 [Telmatospirillum siberiense]|uniref:Uncharacterized protein n=1 Tax=Telmatospirillum siberiense TaxID=382514 RepID=A0A2N3PPM3_9PROT|nr:hypothetical protein CWS72_21985 [Telmatospirillum siberiense]